jgi:hypothetical protein
MRASNETATYFRGSRVCRAMKAVDISSNTNWIVDCAFAFRVLISVGPNALKGFGRWPPFS